MRSILLSVFAIFPIAACASEPSGECVASITANGANATHDQFSAGAALGDWHGNGQTGQLVAVAIAGNLAQSLGITLAGDVPVVGQRYTLTAERTTGVIKYGDSSGQPAPRVWGSTAGTVVVESITPSSTDRSMIVEVSFANVTAAPATDASGNTATGSVTLDGSARIEGVYFPVL